MRGLLNRLFASLRSLGFWFLVCACRALRVRFVGNQGSWLAFSRIGHLASEPDCFVKAGLTGRRPWCIGVILFPRERAANAALLDYWRQRLWVISSPFWVRVLAPLAEVPALRHLTGEYVTAINETATYGAIQAAYAGRPPVLRLTRRHRADGAALLQQLGMPAGAWFVGVHCREGGYDSRDPAHSGRNVPIESYFPAMRAVIARGGWCVRLGDPSMTPLPPMPGVIDYAHSPLRRDWMDIFLCAQARFMLGSASGLCVVAGVFGVPSAVANQSLPAVALPYGAADLFIPKLIRSARTGAHLTLAEILTGPLGNARFTHCMDLARAELENNTPDDVRDLALELLDEIEGTFHETPEDRRRQAAARALLRPGHYSHGAASRFGRLFLRKYHWLLEAPDAGAAHRDYLTRACGTCTCPCLSRSKWAEQLLHPAPPPVALSEFPQDVLAPALDSSGIHVDGWVEDAASCVLTQPAGGALVLRGMFPQIGPRPVASQVRVLIDGHEVLRRVLLPGAVDLTCRVPPGEGTRRVELRFSVTQRLPAPDTRTAGMHVTYLGFQPAAVARAG